MHLVKESPDIASQQPSNGSPSETEELKRQRKWFETALASIGDGVITADPEGNVTLLNPVAEQLTGWSSVEAIGQPLEKIFHIVNEDTRAEVENPALRAIEDGVIFGLANHTLLINREGREIAIDDSGAPIKSGGEMLGAVLVFRDITERRRADQARALLAGIVDSSDDAIVSKSLEGIITSWNRAAERMFGWTADEAVGKSVIMIIPPELRDEETMILSRLRQGQRIEHVETVRVTKDGRRLNISLTVSPVRNKYGEIIGASKIARDITSRVHAEEERATLLASERAARGRAEAASRAKDEFVAMISHEIRSPLNAILGWSQMLSQETLDKTATVNALESIERNARAQAQLVSDLLDVSRVITGKLRINARPVDITASIESALEAIRPAADAKEITIAVEREPYASVVTGDADRLQQVFWNLLSNAVKFTPRHGRVEVQISRFDSQLGITVRDTGAGIKPEFLPFIFDRFTQADTTTARQHAGVGKGASFRITLPIRALHRDQPGAPAPQESVSALAGEITLDEVRVLVVDDEAETRDLLKIMLTSHGAEVITSASAGEALTRLDNSKPDVLVSDIGMPVLDGYAFIKRVRALDSSQRDIPAIALTAYARAEDRMRALAAGFQMHVPKPVEASELVMVIASLTKRI